MRPTPRPDAAAVRAPGEGATGIDQLKRVVEAYFRDGSLAEDVSIVHRRSGGRGALLRVATGHFDRQLRVTRLAAKAAKP